MKKLALLILSISTFSLYASESVIRLEYPMVEEIVVEVECVANQEQNVDVIHNIEITTQDYERIEISRVIRNSLTSSCGRNKKEVSSRQAKILIALNSIKLGGIDVHEKNGQPVCSKTYLDVVLDEDGNFVKAKPGKQVVHCP